MDRRSLKRLLARLSNEGQVKLLRIILRSEEDNRTRALNFVCKPGVDMKNSVIRSAVDQAKMKLFCLGKQKMTNVNLKMEKQAKLDFSDKSPMCASISQSAKQAKEQLSSKKLVAFHQIYVS